MPCFINQAINTSNILRIPQSKRLIIIKKVCSVMSRQDLSRPPVYVAKEIYRIISDVAGVKDPFLKIKKQSTKLSLALYPKIKKIVDKDRNSLKKAVEMAGAGNVIDFGAKSAGHIDKQVDSFMRGKMSSFQKDIGYQSFNKFGKKVVTAKSLLYIADNVGETIFDRILIEEIIKINKSIKITYVVRSQPILNDALIADAKSAGLDSLVKIISAGKGYPGLIMEKTNKEFKDKFKKYDIVIAKGQGNFEALSEYYKKIFFLFLVKCPIVAKHSDSKVGTIIFR